MNLSGKSALVLLILGFITIPATSVLAIETRFTSETLLRSYERDTSTQENVAVIPLYEFIQVETGSLTKPGLSVHAYGWGRTDFGDRDFFSDNETGELLYGFVEYAYDPFSLLARFGRQNIFDGPSNEVIDGLSISGELIKGLSLDVFFGLPVSLAESAGTSGDTALGSKITWNSGEKYDVAFSYKKLENDSTLDDELVGFDFFYAFPKDIDFSVLSTRSLVTDDWREHFVEAHVPIKSISARPYFQRFRYEDLFNTRENSANPFRYLAGTNEVLTTIGSDFIWTDESGFDFGVKAKAFDFKERSDTAEYIGGTAVWHPEEMSQLGLEAGVSAGDDARDEYILARIYAYWEEVPFELPLSFLTADLMYVDYGKAINNEDSSSFFSVGGGMRFLDDALIVKLSADYSSDPFYKEDYRSTLSVTYQFKKVNEDEE